MQCTCPGVAGGEAFGSIPEMNMPAYRLMSCRRNRLQLRVANYVLGHRPPRHLSASIVCMVPPTPGRRPARKTAENAPFLGAASFDALPDRRRPVPPRRPSQASVWANSFV